MAASSGKITVRVSKTVQEEQYEPLQVTQEIEETCSKKDYDSRLIELTGMLSDNIYDFLEGEDENPQEVEDPEEQEEAEGGEELEEEAPGEEEEPSSEEDDDFFNFGEEEDEDDVPIG